MEILKYNIFCRYEYWGKNGKEWTEWHRTNNSYNTENEVIDAIKLFKDNIKQIDKFTKLKHEYKYELIDETLLPIPNLIRPKGRPKKIEKEYLDKIIKILKKKNEVLIEDDIKAFLYNDNESKDYIKSHFDQSTNIVYWYDFLDENKKLYVMVK